MKLFSAIIITLMSLLIYMSCSPQYIIPKRLKYSPDCETSIEGNYFHVKKWSKEAPAIITGGSFLSPKILIFGDIIEKRDDGIVFLQKKENALHRVKEKFYPYEKLECVIDENHKAIYGEISSKYENSELLTLYLINTNDTTALPIMLELIANEHFGFCVPPGDYEIKQLFFTESYSGRNCLVDSINLRISIEKNVSNYIGDIFVNNDKIATKNEINLKNNKRFVKNNKLSFWPGFSGNSFRIEYRFGTKNGGSIPLQDEGYNKKLDNLKIIINKNFKSKTNKPIKANPIYINEKSIEMF